MKWRILNITYTAIETNLKRSWRKDSLRVRKAQKKSKILKILFQTWFCKLHMCANLCVCACIHALWQLEPIWIHLPKRLLRTQSLKNSLFRHFIEVDRRLKTAWWPHKTDMQAVYTWTREIEMTLLSRRIRWPFDQSPLPGWWECRICRLLVQGPALYSCSLL